MVDKTSASYAKKSKLAAIGAGVGAGVGEVIAWYLVGEGGHYWGGGLGALIGICLAYCIPLSDKDSSQAYVKIESTEKQFSRAVGILAFLLSLTGLIGFVMTRQWIGILGAIFFGICGAYLLMKRD